MLVWTASVVEVGRAASVEVKITGGASMEVGTASTEVGTTASTEDSTVEVGKTVTVTSRVTVTRVVPAQATSPAAELA